MSKPTIFFSHASEDEVYLKTIKKLLLTKTNNTVDIFLSSDGQSIPFGTNWVHEIENSLERADLVFVFLSPRSLASQWVFFEAGYTYSKDIEVIPIGILGTDLSEISPPLNLLQGFNLSSREQLENIISVINKKFNFTHTATISQEEYQRIQETTNKGSQNERLRGLVDRLYITLNPHLTEDIKPVSKVWSNLKTYLKKQNIEHNSPYAKEAEEVILIHGAKFRKVESDKNQEEAYLTVELDLFLLNRNLSQIKRFLEIALTESRKNYYLLVFFKDKVNILSEEHAITSRLYETDVSLSSKGLCEYKYKNLNFTISKRGELGEAKTALKIIYSIEDLEEIHLLELLNLLNKANIITTP